MAEDLELNAMFELAQPVAPMPRSCQLMRLDDFFEADDYGINTTESSQRDEDVTEIFISQGRVVRKYR